MESGRNAFHYAEYLENTMKDYEDAGNMKTYEEQEKKSQTHR